MSITNVSELSGIARLLKEHQEYEKSVCCANSKQTSRQKCHLCTCSDLQCTGTPVFSFCLSKTPEYFFQFHIMLTRMQQNISSLTGRVLRSARAPTQKLAGKAFSAYAPSDLKVEHSAAKQEFFVCMGDDCAVIQYQRTNNTLDLYHTEVPSVFRGQGSL
ncbi:uncharacterized protein LOC117640887 isoform X2 [Thrips palmi]|uniref:Protein NATD1 n=1 Tax=Thrips palmi TaxID=161013 RepID=A0A6P8YBU5_THRPL|nr:uncharacterized protein LOC117640887 isoform X2 [Thrips palmi]